MDKEIQKAIYEALAKGVPLTKEQRYFMENRVTENCERAEDVCTHPRSSETPPSLPYS
jgi:hypothetical protein